MAYANETGYLLWVDKEGTASETDPVPSPAAGLTLAYTTEQGVVFERSAAQWFCDSPALVQSNETVTLTDVPQVVVGPYVVPDAIDADYPAIYKIEFQIAGTYVPDAVSSGIVVECYADGSSAAPVQLIAGQGNVGTTCIFWISAMHGQEIDIRCYLNDPNDQATISFIAGTIRRDFRFFP
jgi:hypothetical protein